MKHKETEVASNLAGVERPKDRVCISLKQLIRWIQTLDMLCNRRQEMMIRHGRVTVEYRYLSIKPCSAERTHLLLGKVGTCHIQGESGLPPTCSLPGSSSRIVKSTLGIVSELIDAIGRAGAVWCSWNPS